VPGFTFIDNAEMAIRLVLATCLCGIIGLERELKHQAAGFRTHILVGVGSCLVMMLSFAVAGEWFDPGRIAAQVVTGVGFLGAGAIIRHRDSVRGLTTAASIWCAAALGLAIGAGWYEAAAITTAIVLLTLLLLKFVERRLPGDDAPSDDQ